MIRSAERADARANRVRLIQAAHAVFRERGLDAEMKEIAERASLGIGTIYRNFPAKGDLIAAIVGEAAARIDATITSALAAPDMITAIRSFLRGGFQIQEEYGDLLMAMMGGDAPASCKEQFRKSGDLGRVAGLIRKGMESGEFRPDLDAEIAAARLVSSFVPWHYHQLRQHHTLEQLVDAYTDLFLCGTLVRADGEQRVDQAGGSNG